MSQVLLTVDPNARNPRHLIGLARGIIQTRLELAGVSAFNINSTDDTPFQIVVKFTDPNPERIKKLITEELRLEVVHILTPSERWYKSKAEAIQALGGTIPENRRVLRYIIRDETKAIDKQPELFVYWVIAESGYILGGAHWRACESLTEEGYNAHVWCSLIGEAESYWKTWTATH